MEKEEDYLFVHDIRNKLSPITTLISLIERGEGEYVKKILPTVKNSVNYLAQRDVYDERDRD